MKLDRRAIAEKITTACKDQAKFSDVKCRDIAFHMTDWIDELELLVETYANISEVTVEDVHQVLIKFLVHAPEHISSAAKLVTGFPVEHIFDDDFNEGADFSRD